MKRLLSFIITLAAILAFADDTGKKVAVVQLLRGDVNVELAAGNIKKLGKGDWVVEGAIVRTGEKSFAKLSFIDKSTMNVGPSSEMKIEKFSKDEAGVINVLSGKIRSKVTKNYLDMDQDKSKLFIKSKSAVMGIRGTDFMFTANKKTGNTTAVLFEGKVVFNKLKPGANNRDLESIVNKGRAILPGQYSVASNKYSKPTVPAKMNSSQLKGLEKNESMLDNAAAVSNSGGNKKKAKSIAPPGLTGQQVASEGEGLKTSLGNMANIDVQENKIEITAESKGYAKGSDIKPADGSPVDIDTGAIIPLGSDSTFDSNTGEWVSNSVGAIDAGGDYVPPEGYAITDTGEMVVVDKSNNDVLTFVDQPIMALDEVPPLEDRPIVEKKIEVEGPKPASTNTSTSVETKTNTGTSLEGGGEPEPQPEPEPKPLPRPPAPCLSATCNPKPAPLPTDTLAPPPTNISSKTKVKINVQKGQ